MQKRIELAIAYSSTKLAPFFLPNMIRKFLGLDKGDDNISAPKSQRQKGAQRTSSAWKFFFAEPFNCKHLGNR